MALTASFESGFASPYFHMAVGQSAPLLPYGSQAKRTLVAIYLQSVDIYELAKPHLLRFCGSLRPASKVVRQ